MATPPDFAELQALSNFSFLRGASHPEELVERAGALGYRALALTDECSLAGVVRAWQAAKTHALALITGTQIALADGPPLVLLATDRAGYGRLASLVTTGRRRSRKGHYRLLRADLDDGLPGCLALLPVTPDADDDAPAAWFAERFAGRGWLAVGMFRDGRDRDRLARARALGGAFGLPLVAAGDVHMHVRARKPLQDVLTAIRLGVPLAEAGHALQPNAERHLRSRAALARLYPPALLAETLAVAERCRFDLGELRYEYPDEVAPPGVTPAAHLRALAEAGLARRYPAGTPAKVTAQVEHELRLIGELAYEPYFLTVHDIVAWARGQGILCQGRGSAANSAVCYALGITEVDPARMELLFERFVSAERREPPDIDVDFEHERREEVIQYIYARYGRDRAALAATVITYRPRSALRDAGRALGLSPDQTTALARQVHWWDGKRIDPARLRESGLDPEQPAIARTLAMAGALVGFPRHLSQHVGGFIISRGPLRELVPIENAAMPERTVIQWEKDDIEALGLLKIDCLALGMLSALRRGLQYAGRLRGRPLTLADVPPEDPATYAMIRQADTVGVFQIESRAQMAMLPRLAPRTFYDLVIEIALIRPGPIQGEMVHPFLRRRAGIEPIDYPSEEVRGVLERTLGVPLFQEQVIKLAMVAAGFSPGEADGLRRSMATWKRNGGITRYEQRLIEGMRARGYREDYARRIYQQILGFGEYGFPESHSASFALLAYASAWLKCHEPAAFTCALLNSQPMGFYGPSQLVQDARRHGVEVRPARVTASAHDCTLEPDIELSCGSGRQPANAPHQPAQPDPQGTCGSGRQPANTPPQPAQPDPQGTRGSGRQPANTPPQPALRLGLRLVKGLSQAAADRIVTARAHAPFASVTDLAHRAALDRRDLDALAAADALADLAGHRHRARWQALGVERGAPLLAGLEVQEALPLLPAPGEGENIAADYAATGLTLRRHPLALLRGRLQRLGVHDAAAIAQCPHGTRLRTAGLVVTRQRPGTATGVVFITLEDENGSINLIVWSSLVERYRREVLGARLLGVDGEVQREGLVVHVIARELHDWTPLLGELVTRSRDFH